MALWLVMVDIGCGTGGPARYLASNYGCHVEGIDLTPELVETGQILTERCGLSELINLQIGNALDLPFPDESFDVVWCQNVTMNIENKMPKKLDKYSSAPRRPLARDYFRRPLV